MCMGGVAAVVIMFSGFSLPRTAASARGSAPGARASSALSARTSSQLKAGEAVCLERLCGHFRGLVEVGEVADGVECQTAPKCAEIRAAALLAVLSEAAEFASSESASAAEPSQDPIGCPVEVAESAELEAAPQSAAETQPLLRG